MRCTMPSASGSSRKVFTSLNQYYVIMEVTPEFRRGPDALRLDLSAFFGRAAGAAERRSPIRPRRRRRCWSTTRASSPRSRSRFNLAPHASIGTAVTQVQQAVQALHLPPSIAGRIPGHRAGLPDGAGRPADA